MGNDISPGHTYTSENPGNQVTSQNLNDHVGEAQIKETFVSSKSLKSSPQLSDVILITDGTLKKTTLDNVQTLLEGNMVLGTSNYGEGTVTSLSLADSAVTSSKIAPDAIHGQTEKTTLVDTDEVLLWDSEASALKKAKRSTIYPSGSVIQKVYVETKSYSSISTVIPSDDTIPQNTEGTQILSASITPTSSSNSLIITLAVSFASSTGRRAILALFKDSESSAFATVADSSPGSDVMGVLPMMCELSPATTSSVTVSARIGIDTSGYGIIINGIAAGRRFGGTAVTSMTIEEIKA